MIERPSLKEIQKAFPTIPYVLELLETPYAQSHIRTCANRGMSPKKYIEEHIKMGTKNLGGPDHDRVAGCLKQLQTPEALQYVTGCMGAV